MNRIFNMVVLIAVFHATVSVEHPVGTGKLTVQLAAQNVHGSQPLDLTILSASMPGQADWFATEQELVANSRSIQPDGSVYPLANAVQIAGELKQGSSDVLNGQTLPALHMPFKLLNVNSVMEKVLKVMANQNTDAKDGSPKVVLTWHPRIYGVAYQQVFQRGCSDIPLYEDYSVLLRYEVAVDVNRIDPTGKTSTSTPLRLELDDPSPVYIRTRCWKQVNRSNTPVFQRDARAGATIGERLNSVRDALDKWLTDNVDDFEDDVKSRLAPKTDATGNVMFDGLSRQSTVKTKDNIRMRWTFSADEGTQAALASVTR